ARWRRLGRDRHRAVYGCFCGSGQFASGCVAMFTILGERPGEDRFDAGWKIGTQRADWRGLLADMLVHQAEWRLGTEWQLPGEHLEQHDTHCVNVGATIEGQ